MRPRAFALRTPTSHHGLPQVTWSRRATWVASIMQPTITREIIDRRQPALRWSAILGGTAVAVGVWGVLQLIATGVGLVAVDPDDATSVVPAAIGTTAFSVLAPLIAMFVGGWVAARLANTWDRQVAGSHGLVVWGLTSVFGILTTVLLASAIGHGASNMDRRGDRVADARFADVDDALVPINERLTKEGQPVLTSEQLVAAGRAAHDDDGYDRDEFIEELDDVSALDKAGATRVVDQLGSRAMGIVTLAATPTPAEHDAMYAAEQAGKGVLALGLAILLSAITAIAGALVALRNNEENRRGPHTTAPYPVTTPPVDRLDRLD